MNVTNSLEELERQTRRRSFSNGPKDTASFLPLCATADSMHSASSSCVSKIPGGTGGVTAASSSFLPYASSTNSLALSDEFGPEESDRPQKAYRDNEGRSRASSISSQSSLRMPTIQDIVDGPQLSSASCSSPTSVSSMADGAESLFLSSASAAPDSQGRPRRNTYHGSRPQSLTLSQQAILTNANQVATILASGASTATITTASSMNSNTSKPQSHLFLSSSSSPPGGQHAAESGSAYGNQSAGLRSASPLVPSMQALSVVGSSSPDASTPSTSTSTSTSSASSTGLYNAGATGPSYSVHGPAAAPSAPPRQGVQVSFSDHVVIAGGDSAFASNANATRARRGVSLPPSAAPFRGGAGVSSMHQHHQHQHQHPQVSPNAGAYPWTLHAYPTAHSHAGLHPPSSHFPHSQVSQMSSYPASMYSSHSNPHAHAHSHAHPYPYAHTNMHHVSPSHPGTYGQNAPAGPAYWGGTYALSPSQGAQSSPVGGPSPTGSAGQIASPSHYVYGSAASSGFGTQSMFPPGGSIAGSPTPVIAPGGGGCVLNRSPVGASPQGGLAFDTGSPSPVTPSAASPTAVSAAQELDEENMSGLMRGIDWLQRGKVPKQFGLKGKPVPPSRKRRTASKDDS
eukprot:ANDGO_00325.mRNA.1 hypothetical protein